MLRFCVIYLQFVAHPHCQQRLIEQWYHGLPGWRDQGSFKSGLTVLLMGLSFPLLSIAYILFPYGKLGRFLRIPYVKFVCHTASQLCFLLLLLYQTIGKSQDKIQRLRPFFRNDWIWLWNRFRLDWPRVCFDTCACFAYTHPGFQTRGRSLKPNPKPKPWFRKRPIIPIELKEKSM